MNRKPVEQNDRAVTPVAVKKKHAVPKLAELGSLAALTKMDGIPHNGGGAISGNAP
jgi:hypothetical protein